MPNKGNKIIALKIFFILGKKEMKEKTKIQIKELISNVIVSKLQKYKAETEYRPFYEALL